MKAESKVIYHDLVKQYACRLKQYIYDIVNIVTYDISKQISDKSYKSR